MKLSLGPFILVLASLVLLPLQASGQAKLPWEEYDKLIDTRATIKPMGPDLFGDQVNLYNTALSFSVTDISLSGNHDLPVALTRTFSVKSRKLSAQKDLPMATWDLDLPRLEGVFAANAIAIDPVWPDDRCTGNGRPPSVTVVGGNTYGANQYWHGNHAHMPGGGEIILADQGATQPTASGDWKWMTSNFTYFSCLTSTPSDSNNGIHNGTGDGFLAITSDGTRYWFDWMAQYHEDALKNPETSDGPPEEDPPEDEPPDDEEPRGAGELTRKRNVLYATRVEDRFGNWVEYTFDNDYDQPAKLTAITASDGSQITLTYDGQNRVATASDGTGSWVYEYCTVNDDPDDCAVGDLKAVTLPDQSQWTINFGGLWDVEIQYDADPTGRHCGTTAPGTGLARGGEGTVKHPAGAVGYFQVKRVFHGRSNVPMFCHNWEFGPDGNDPTNDVAQWPRAYNLLGLYKKRVSGWYMSTEQWTYSTGAQISWADGTGPVCNTQDPDNPDCDEPVCLDDGCAGVATTTINGPGWEWTRYTFGNSYRYNEGKLLKIERGTGSTDVWRTEEMEYELSQPELEPGTEQPFPIPVGTSPNNRGDVFAAAYLAPLKQRTINQQNTDFFYIVEDLGEPTRPAFDEFARPVIVTRANSQGESRVEETVYHDNLDLWVLGQIGTVTMTGEKRGVEVSAVAEENTYDPTWAVPLESQRFDKTVQTLSWDTTSPVASGQRGTVSTVTDGNNNTTTLANWKLGIPQAIDYADGESVSAVVDDDGTIASVTDENGYKTCYEYDIMGRLTKITYPSESQVGVCDDSTWNVTHQSFVQLDEWENNFAPGHWRQTISTGDGYKVTYFDNLWRPSVIREYDATDESSTRRCRNFKYDHEGRVRFASYPSHNCSHSYGTRTYYDLLGRVYKVEQHSELDYDLGRPTTTTNYLHDADLGYYTQVTDPNGNVTQTWYQAFDEPSYETPLMHLYLDVYPEFPENVYTVFGRDFLGQVDWIGRGLDENLLNQLDRSQLHTLRGSASATRDYVYNSYRELCKIIEPETGATIMDYDGAGNLVWSKSGSSHTDINWCNTDIVSVPLIERTTREYDSRNRIYELGFPDGLGDTSYTYTPDGLPDTITVENGDGNVITTAYDYNRRRLPVWELIERNYVDWYIFATSYNANGHVNIHHYYVPWSHDINYAPNALGQPTRAGDFATDVSYHKNGAVKEFTYGNGIVHTLTQNIRGLPDTSTDAYDGTKFLADSYDYDANGNVAAITDGATGTNQRGNRDMVYDGLNRLTGVTSPMFDTATYTYDELDNLTRVKLKGGTASREHYLCYAANTNRLDSLRTGGCSGSAVAYFDYDAQGNVIRKGATVFDFDYGNRLREVAGTTTTSRYEYDGHGRRVRDFLTGFDGGAKFSMYTSDGRLRYTFDDRRGVDSYYVYLGSRLIAIREQEGLSSKIAVKYQHTDALGSPVVVTDEDRKVLEQSEYEPYGSVLNRPLRDGPGYTGHVEDEATGLNYMQQRYYDPEIGRFISADPVLADWETGINFNRYWYANNNPYTFIDPDGRCPEGESKRICIHAEDFDGTRSSGLNAQGTPEMDQAVRSQIGVIRTRSNATREKLGSLNRQEDNSLKVERITDATTSGSRTSDSASGVPPKNAEAIVHGHISPSVADDAATRGDAGAVKILGKPNYAVSQDARIIVHEVAEGRYQVRMIQGRMTNDEIKHFTPLVNSRQELFYEH